MTTPAIDLPAIIRKTVREWIESADDIASEVDINNGFCADFAHTLWQQHPELTVIGLYDQEDAESLGITDEATLSLAREGAFAHSFIQHEGRYFDAETPDGVDAPSMLPILQRVIREKQERNYDWSSGPG